MTIVESDQRTKILAAALQLMSEVGSHAMSMRQLASACNLNPATLYHYFPSKADLLRSVIEDRRYPEQLANDRPPVDASLAPRERMAKLVNWLLHMAADEQSMWKVLMGETLRGNEVASEATVELMGLIDGAFASWLTDSFPEFPGDDAASGRVLRCMVIASLFEDQCAGGEGRKARFRHRADDVAAVLFP